MTRVQDVYPDDRLTLREVGLRDGLQLVKTFPSTAAKQRWIRDEYGVGVRHFEVGSFLPASRFPQFADVLDVVRTVAALPGAHGIALALNERGVNEALASGVAEIASVVSATEEHSQANANRSREQAIANVRRLCELRNATPHKPIVNAAISMALGCSIGQTHIGLMFSLVLAPMIFFGCTYYPWSALAQFPILKRLVLLNPVVFASEGLRSALVPQFPHLPLAAIFGALVFFNVVFIAFGLYRFQKKAVH